jgi:DNA replication protein DnaC
MADSWQCPRCGTVYQPFHWGELRVAARNHYRDGSGVCQQCARSDRTIAQREARLQAILAAYGLAGSRFAEMTLDSYDPRTDNQRKIRQSCEDLVDIWRTSPTRGMVLFGPPGVGKTHLAIAMLREWVLRDYGTAAHYQCAELFKGIKDGFDDKAAPDVVANCQRTGLLILDDVGTEAVGIKDATWRHEQYFLILDARWQHKRPVIITTNLENRTAFDAWIGPRSADRLRDLCAGWAILEGKSYRGKG